MHDFLTETDGLYNVQFLVSVNDVEDLIESPMGFVPGMMLDPLDYLKNDFGASCSESTSFRIKVRQRTLQGCSCDHSKY